jgi:hypothetical protein
MALILDAGALIAVERKDPVALGLLARAYADEMSVRTSSATVAQVWRDGTRQSRLVVALRGIEEVPLDRAEARRIGQLLGSAGTADVVDAAIVTIARDGDDVATSDTTDLRRLCDALGLDVTLVAV